jgi:hypothetical protein
MKGAESGLHVVLPMSNMALTKTESQARGGVLSSGDFLILAKFQFSASVASAIILYSQPYHHMLVKMDEDWRKECWHD